MSGDELTTIIDQIWVGFTNAINQVKHPWRFPVLGTHGINGPDVRTMVLRSVNASIREITVQTDIRSAKIPDLRKDPRVAWHFYDAKSKVQVRAQGRMTVHHNDQIARDAWLTIPEANKRNYSSIIAPGTPINNRELGQAVSGSDTYALENFAVLSTGITSIDWLQLRSEYHQRALFQWTGNDWDSTWTVP